MSTIYFLIFGFLAAIFFPVFAGEFRNFEDWMMQLTVTVGAIFTTIIGVQSW